MILTLRNRLKVLIYLGAAMIIVVSMLEGGPSPGLSINRLSIVEAGLIAVISVFDRYAWRWWTIPRLLKTGPVLRGTWRGVIRPTEGDKQEIVAYLSVRQTFSGIALRLMTEESMSESSTSFRTFLATRFVQEARSTLERLDWRESGHTRNNLKDRTSLLDELQENWPLANTRSALFIHSRKPRRSLANDSSRNSNGLDQWSKGDGVFTIVRTLK
jgi:hypothetical protein